MNLLLMLSSVANTSNVNSDTSLMWTILASSQFSVECCLRHENLFESVLTLTVFVRPDLR